MLFETTASKKLTGFSIWVPQLRGRSENVPSAMSLAPDPRIRHYWDESDDLGAAYEAVLPTTGESAWDVYMLYRSGVVWASAQPPKPDFWMHQLGGVTAAPRLDPDVFAARAKELLRRA